MKIKVSRITGPVGTEIFRLEREGKSIDGIALAVKRDVNDIKGHYLVVGESHRRSTNPQEIVRKMTELGYHNSVIFALMNIDEAGLDRLLKKSIPTIRKETPAPAASATRAAFAYLSPDVERQVIEMKSSGKSIRQIKEELNIDSATYAEAIRRGSARQQSSVVGDKSAVPLQETNTVASDIVFETTVTSEKPQPKESDEDTSIRDRVRLLSMECLTAYELADKAGLTLQEVAHLVSKYNIYVPSGAKEKLQVKVVSDMAYQGSSIDEICKKNYWGKGTVRALAQRIISKNGPHSVILEHLLAGTNTASTVITEVVPPSIENEEESVANEKPIVPTNGWIGTPDGSMLESGNSVVFPPYFEGMREGISQHASDQGIVVSVLGQIALVVTKAKKGQILVRFNEVMRIKGLSEWNLGEEVVYELDGSIITARIKTPPLRTDKGIAYGVSITDNEDDIVLAELFTS